VVHLRQSTSRQVHENQESTRRQYDLRQRALDLGRTAESVLVLGEDLGQRGRSTEHREGFRRLAAEVASGQVGAIFALEPSRFARCSADWHRLLDLCGLTDVLIADEQGVYGPRDPNDRLSDRSLPARASPRIAACEPAGQGPWRYSGVMLLLLIGCASEADSALPTTLVLLTLDTVRGDHIGASTPFLTEMASEGLELADLDTHSWTYPGIGAILTGRHPAAWGIASWTFAPDVGEMP
jgi:hypothetical protein